MKIKKGFYNVEIAKHLTRRDITNLIISIFGLIISTVQILEIRRSAINSIVNRKLIFYNVVIGFIIIFINVYGAINKKEAVINKFSIRKLEEENKNLTEVNDKVRCFKHDFYNIMQAIDGYIILKDLNSLQKYFNSLVKECNYVNSIEFLNCQVRKNPAIYGILLSKYKKAEQNNIKMNIEILVDLSKFNNKSYIISRMLGILLDNAVEASSECEEKVINIKFVNQEEKRRDIIIIENTYKNKKIDTAKIFEKDYTTKVGNSGLGLWKIRDILRKDTNFDLFTSKDDKMFKQQLEIY